MHAVLGAAVVLVVPAARQEPRHYGIFSCRVGVSGVWTARFIEHRSISVS